MARRYLGYCVICWAEILSGMHFFKYGDDMICGLCMEDVLKKIFDGKDLVEALRELGFDAKRVPEEE